MQTCFVSLLLCLLILVLIPNKNTGDELDLSELDHIRVSLFNDTTTANFRINAVDQQIDFHISDRVIQLSPGEGFAFIRHTDSKLVFTLNNLQLEAPSIEIKQKNNGVIQLFTTDIGNRIYHGNFELSFIPETGKIQIINEIDLENYVASVVGGEMNFKETEALKSQAVVSRTYALWSIHQSPYVDFHLKDNEQNQVYVGVLSSRPDFELAAQETKGEILTWSDKLILAAFSSTCGGETSNNEQVWSGNPLPYLRGTQDHNMCSLSPHYTWNYDIKESELFDFIRHRYAFSPTSFDLIPNHNGRVEAVKFQNRSGQILTFQGNEFRLLVNQHFKSNGLKSTRFNIQKKSDKISFNGSGLGHGVGMCQWGAKGFANAGWKYDDILSFYFSGTKIVDLEQIENNKIALSR